MRWDAEACHAGASMNATNLGFPEKFYFRENFVSQIPEEYVYRVTCGKAGS
jgi:hypothetical protein